MPHKGEARPARTGRASTPKQQCQPRTSAKKPKAYLHPNTATVFVNGVGSRRAAPRFPIRTSNAAAWALFTLVVGTGLIVACVLLTLGAPS